MSTDQDFFDNFNKIMDYQIDDLNHCSKIAPFLVAMGCMNTIEFMGGIRNGQLGETNRCVESRFKEGVRLLRTNPGAMQLAFGNPDLDEQTIWQLRNGLTHQYLPKIKKIGAIFITAGIEDEDKFDVVGEIVRGKEGLAARTPFVGIDIIELITAINEGRRVLTNELKTDRDKMLRASQALSRLPELLKQLS